jgi:N-acyl-D-amino-acid deacylase
VPPDKLREYWAALEKNGISLNFGTYFSETQARVAVLNCEARKPTEEELAKMKAILETAMQNGAMGMTTALIYPPSSYTTTDELIEMARVAAKYGGIYASHMRGEGKELVQEIAARQSLFDVRQTTSTGYLFVRQPLDSSTNKAGAISHNALVFTD